MTGARGVPVEHCSEQESVEGGRWFGGWISDTSHMIWLSGVRWAGGVMG